MTDYVGRLFRDPWMYRRILYLLLAFPLGTIYFSVIFTGLSVGLSLAVIVVGLAVLVLTLIVWLLFARLERELAILLLGARIQPLPVPAPASLRPWPRLLQTLGEPVTWKSLAYLLIEFPFGILSFTLVLVLVLVPISLVLVPLAYLYNVAFGPYRGVNLDFGFGSLAPDGHPFGVNFLACLILGIVGVALLVGAVTALNGLGWLWGQFAQGMLGTEENRVQLARAKAEADSQRERAEQSDQRRRELIVNASHELRTPVASISAHVESLLKPDRPLDDEARKYLGVVATETERLGSLVDDMLTLARADAGELRLQLGPVDVADVIRQVCDALAPLARQERNLSLVHAEPPGLPRVTADRDRLTQVLTNLIRNAVNYTPDGGIISVDAVLAGAQVVVTVSDTGIGMAPEDLRRVFDRFYRSDQSRTRDSGGSGLGLAIVRDLLGAMGASIDAESTPQHGSVFHVRLQREAA